MIQQEIERERVKTDRAWSKLYDRLDSEGLLADSPCRTMFRSTVWRWASAVAAVVILCVYFTTAHFSTEEPSEMNNLLMRQNQESTTLVATLEDGSIVYLAGKTSLRYPEHFAPHQRAVSLSGNALFDVAGNRSRPFFIETKEVQIEVLGTAFDVRSDGTTPFELSVQRGEVKVTLKRSGQNIHVKAGETVKLLSEKFQLSATNNPQLFSRYTETIRFKDERVADILRVINQQEQAVRLQTSAEIGERMLTVTFSNHSPEVVAQLICLAMNLQCTSEKGVFTLSE